MNLRDWMKSHRCPRCGSRWTARKLAPAIHIKHWRLSGFLRPAGDRRRLVPTEEERASIEWFTRQWGKPEDAVTAEEWDA